MNNHCCVHRTHELIALRAMAHFMTTFGLLDPRPPELIVLAILAVVAVTSDSNLLHRYGLLCRLAGHLIGVMSIAFELSPFPLTLSSFLHSNMVLGSAGKHAV